VVEFKDGIISLQNYMELKTVTRPWGEFRQFTHNELSTVKVITVNPHEQLSLQYHKRRAEFWRILSGNPIIHIGDKKIEAKQGDEFTVDVEAPHQIIAQDAPVRVLEISTGDFDENDIIRLEDKYGRV
jgi:mannose-6-phosphate isomerase-like protein (cupin superfamily)